MKIDSNKVMVGLMDFVLNTVGEIIVPNYYLGSWECDLYKVSTKGFDTEYEIKISKSDFKNDFKKQHESLAENWREHWDAGTELPRKTKNKHDLILNGERCNRFYFVMPEGMVDLNEVPKYCGVIFFYEQYGELRFRTARASKLLKKEPINHEKYKHIAGNLCIKLHVAKRKLKTKLKQKA